MSDLQPAPQNLKTRSLVADEGLFVIDSAGLREMLMPSSVRPKLLIVFSPDNPGKTTCEPADLGVLSFQSTDQSAELDPKVACRVSYARFLQFVGPEGMNMHPQDAEGLVFNESRFNTKYDANKIKRVELYKRPAPTNATPPAAAEEPEAHAAATTNEPSVPPPGGTP